MNGLYLLVPFLLFGIPVAFADVVSYDYSSVDNHDGTFTYTTHYPYLFNGTDYVPFIQNGNQIDTTFGNVTAIGDGSFRWNDMGITDRIIAKYADISNLNSWTYLTSLNNDIPDISFDGTTLTASKVKSGIGQLDYKYILDNGRWKTQLEATNFSGLSSKAFGFDEWFDIDSDTVKFGRNTINLDNYNNTTFDRNWIDSHESKVFTLLNGIRFDFDKGLENLHSITVIDTGPNKTRLVFDYRTSTILLPGQTLIIDPSYSPSLTSENSLESGAGTTCSGRTYVSLYGDDRITWDASICRIPYFSYNIAGLTPGSTVISAATWTYDTVTATSITGSCQLRDSVKNPSGNQTVYDSVFTGSTISSSFTSCNSIGDNRVVNFDSTGVTKIQENVDGIEGFYAFFVWFATEPTVGTEAAFIRQSDAVLSITYSNGTVGSPPNPVTDVTYANLGPNSVDVIWQPPTSFGTGTFQTYVLNSTTPYGQPLTFRSNQTSLFANVTGLTLGTQYSFRIAAATEIAYNTTGSYILNVTTTSPSYSTPPTDLIVFPANYTSTSQLNLQWAAGSMQNVNGYRIERETPSGSGWTTIVSNTTNTNTYYNNTGLSTNVIYNYRVSALNGTGISTTSNEYEMTTYHLPDAVTDLAAEATNLSTVILTWTAPTSYAPEITGYHVNFTTPYGAPDQVISGSPIAGSLVTKTVTGLTIGVEYSFRIAPITFHGYNATGNIANATTFNQFEVGDLPDVSTPNPLDAQIFFNRTDVSATTVQLDVTYSDTYDLACDIAYKYARTNQTYYPLNSTVVDADDVYSRFTFYNATNEVMRVECWDVGGTDSAKYVITITDFPLLQQIDNLSNGTYGTMGEFGAIDLVSLLVIIISMIGLNRTNPIAGVIFVVIAEFVLAYFGVVSIPQVLLVGFATVIMLAIMVTRKDD